MLPATLPLSSSLTSHPSAASVFVSATASYSTALSGLATLPLSTVSFSLVLTAVARGVEGDCCLGAVLGVTGFELCLEPVFFLYCLLDFGLLSA